MGYPPQGAGGGDMTKAVYDPDKDGLIALAQLVAAVCSDTELSDHAGIADAHHAVHLKTLADHVLGTVVPHDALASLTEKAFASLTGRWTLAQAHRGADGKLMVFKGAEADPTEISIGTGAGEVAAGDHTHTLVEDTIDSALTALTVNLSSGYYKTVAIGADADTDIASVTDTFAAGSMAVAVGFIVGQNAAGTNKLRLYMDGVQVAESATIAHDVYIVVGTKALSGSKICKIAAHNYGAGGSIGLHAGLNGDTAGAGIGEGSIKT